MSATADTAAIATRAAQLIRSHGWVQHWFGNTDTGFCLLGACVHALDESGESTWSAMTPVSQALSGALFPTDDFWITKTEVDWEVSRWNDKPGRTKAEVLDLLDQIGRGS